MKYSVLVVDDEKHARTRILKYLGKDPEITVIGECTNGKEAIESIRKRKPDIIFLDIQMPEIDGLGVVETIGVDNMPAVIFVTAYDQYAVNAFKVNALDYVLKPIGQERLNEALNKAKANLGGDNMGDLNNRLMGLIKQMNQEQSDYLDRITIKSSDHIYFIKVGDIDWIEADDNYVRIHTNDKTHLLRETMKNLENTLNPSAFLRIHRSAIVNMDRIKEIQQWFNNEYVVILKNGKELTMSRGYRDKAKKIFQNRV